MAMIPSWLDPEPPIEQSAEEAAPAPQDRKAEAEFQAAVAKAAGRSAGAVQSFGLSSALVWVYDLIKVAGKGRRVGNIDRTAPTILIEIDYEKFGADWQYRKVMGNRMALGMGEGLCVGDAKIQYSGGTKELDWLGYNPPRVSVGARADSFEKETEGNFAENFHGGTNASDYQVNKAGYFKPLTFKAISIHDDPDKPVEAFDGVNDLEKPKQLHYKATPKPVFGTRKVRPRKERVSYLDKLAGQRKREEKRLEKLAKRHFKPCECDGCENGARGKYCSDRCSTIARSRRYRVTV